MSIKLFVVVGSAGVGKSTLIRWLEEEWKGDPRVEFEAEVRPIWFGAEPESEEWFAAIDATFYNRRGYWAAMSSEVKVVVVEHAYETSALFSDKWNSLCDRSGAALADRAYHVVTPFQTSIDRLTDRGRPFEVRDLTSVGGLERYLTTYSKFTTTNLGRVFNCPVTCQSQFKLLKVISDDITKYLN